MVTDPAAQTEAVLALHERFGTRVLLTCMDLSVEAEAFGAELGFTDDEVPTVLGQRIQDPSEIRQLRVPEVGTARTAVALEVVRRLARHAPETAVVAGVTGPFSMAARLLGVTEALVLTLEDPSSVRSLVSQCGTFLGRYVCALRDAGAAGVFMAEPTAGLISPAAMATFCTPAVHEVIAAVADPRFAVLLHNCAAREAHLPAMVGGGVAGLHVGAPMELAAALRAVGDETLVLGNLDPAALFVAGSPDTVAAAVADRLSRFGCDPRFVLSSGCDLPRATPLENLAAFFDAARL